MLPVLILAAVLLLGAPGARAEEGEKTTATNWHALLVGVSEYPVLRKKLGEERYKARRVALKGPPNDVALMRDLLLEVVGIPSKNITELVGWPTDEKSRPTYKNIIAALDRLGATVKKGDRVVIHMGGHGCQVPDTSGDELDGKDEVFLPADTGTWEKDKISNVITDDELNKKVRRIRDAGAFVWLIMDCCHSGTIVRGTEEGVQTRRLDPDDLGVPITATRGTSSREDYSKEESQNLERIV
ncbi:MAG: caspase family protein, partial [Planctomycetota bacterium]|nr:caspase family protein [Planctomycetota bacterium]